MRGLRNLRNFDVAPFRLFDEFEKDMRRMLDYGLETKGVAGRDEFGFAPLCDMRDLSTHYLLNFDLPGISKDDVKVEIKDGRLSVSGERRSEVKEGDYTEKSYGKFERMMTLPQDANEGDIQAHFENGVLSLAIPKAKKAQPKPIAIHEGKREGFWSKLLHGPEAETENKNANVA